MSATVQGDGGLISKRLELLKDAVPNTSRVGICVNPNDADIGFGQLPRSGLSRHRACPLEKARIVVVLEERVLRK
jgi:hypothetical protein